MACDCSSEVATQSKSTIWIPFQGTFYHSFIYQKLASLPPQPSAIAEENARSQCIQRSFSHYMRQSLLPFQAECPNCHKVKNASFVLEAPYPQVLLIRFSWSTTFPTNEKNLTFCGIPELVMLDASHDV